MVWVAANNILPRRLDQSGYLLGKTAKERQEIDMPWV